MPSRARPATREAPDAEAHLREVFAAWSPIPDDEWRFFWPQVRPCHYAARAHVVREGHPAPLVHFIVKGLVRIYQQGDGIEHVRGFDYEGRFIAAYESVLSGGASSVSMQALEPLETLAFPSLLLPDLYERHRCWERFGRRILEQKWVQHQDKERRFATLTPEAHYRELLARRSPLIGRVPLKELAAYLQVAPETLSRIRTRVHGPATGQRRGAT